MKHIIVVDDDQGIQDIAKLILERVGYRVTVFANGTPLLRNTFEVPDIFILNKLLGSMEGMDICRFLKGFESTKDIPVILLSALPNIEKLLKEACADDFLEKPFLIKDLLAMIRKYI